MIYVVNLNENLVKSTVCVAVCNLLNGIKNVTRMSYGLICKKNNCLSTIIFYCKFYIARSFLWTLQKGLQSPSR